MMAEPNTPFTSDEPDDEYVDGTTKSRRVRMLQAYSRAIQDMEDSSQSDESVFEAPPRSSRPKLSRSGTVSDAMENLVHMDEDMAPYKLLNFLLHGSIAGTMPYFTLYSKQLGLDAAQVGMVCGIRPVLISIVTPLVGWFADKYHTRRLSAILCSTLWVLLALLVAIVPPPSVAECDTAIEKLQIILPDEHVISYLDCKDIPINAPTPDTLSRHLFLAKVYLPNITAELKNDCANQTNSSKVIPTESFVDDSNRNKSDVADRKRRTIMGVWEGTNVDVVDNGEGDVDGRRKARDGSWLFNSISLRDAFISAFILAAFADMMQAPSISLVDVATLDSLGRGVQREGYGWQRAFGVVGYVIFSIIILCILAFSTTIITICGIDVKFVDYKVAFVIFAGVMACAVAIVCSISFKYEDSHSYHLREVLDVLLTIKYGTILLTAFFLAICNGCINTFLLWHLENLGATNVFFILALLSFGVSEVAVSFYLPIFIRSKGHACLVLMGVWIYCFIFIGYALMEKPHWVVIIEIFHGAAFALTWNPITTYLTGAVCREYLATMQGIITGANHGLGNVIGSVCAGLMVRSNGAVVTFYGFAVMCMVYGILFLVVNRETGLLHNCRKQQSKYATIGTNTEHH